VVALQRARAAEAEARTHYQSTRDALAVLQPPAGSTSLVHDWAALADWCAVTATVLEAEQNEVTAAGKALAATHQALKAEVREAVTGLIDRPDAPVDDVRDQLVAAGATARAAIEQFERERERVAAQLQQVAQLRAEADVARTLGELLKTSNFQQWLLEEAMDDLVSRATVRLHELTAGQYSLRAEAGAFRIVDHRNADEVRDARSLSGGETFLTSLALALALADSSADLAAEGTAPMESIFLDEGFGTLDPDTLDVVAGTIEELGASGRMVGIVTHIRELAERMPTRFEVAKGPSGSTVSRVDQ
jgi:exonuclease SbcC